MAVGVGVGAGGFFPANLDMAVGVQSRLQTVHAEQVHALLHGLVLRARF